MTEVLARPAAIPRFVERSFDFMPIRATDGADGGDGRTFDGYAAVFNSLTRIDSWEGYFDEQIAKGAFRKSIRERMPVLQFDHGRSTTIGSMPIGVIKKLGEDDRGLHVEARMHAAPLFEPLRENLIAGSINGMSFRFEVVKEDWHFRGKKVTDPEQVLRLIWRRETDMADDEVIVRTLRELKVPELGPVVFPAYPDTTASVRGREIIDLMIRDQSMVLQVRNSIARAMGEPSTEEVSEGLVDNTSDDTPDESGTETGDQTDSITPEPTDVPDGATEVNSNEAPAEDEPPAPEGHSEETGEPPAVEGHSKPDGETPDGGRSATLPVITATNLDDAERQLARQRIAEKIAARNVQATSKLEKYSNV